MLTLFHETNSTIAEQSALNEQHEIVAQDPSFPIAEHQNQV